jgi:hypothetical protein
MRMSFDADADAAGTSSLGENLKPVGSSEGSSARQSDPKVGKTPLSSGTHGTLRSPAAAELPRAPSLRGSGDLDDEEASSRGSSKPKTLEGTEISASSGASTESADVEDET